jgi:hypothetical protein
MDKLQNSKDTSEKTRIVIPVASGFIQLLNTIATVVIAIIATLGFFKIYPLIDDLYNKIDVKEQQLNVQTKQLIIAGILTFIDAPQNAYADSNVADAINEIFVNKTIMIECIADDNKFEQFVNEIIDVTTPSKAITLAMDKFKQKYFVDFHLLRLIELYELEKLYEKINI